MKDTNTRQNLDKKFQQAFAETEVKVTSYSGTILVVATIIFVSCFGLFLYGVLNS